MTSQSQRDMWECSQKTIMNAQQYITQVNIWLEESAHIYTEMIEKGERALWKEKKAEWVDVIINLKDISREFSYFKSSCDFHIKTILLLN